MTWPQAARSIAWAIAFVAIAVVFAQCVRELGHRSWDHKALSLCPENKETK